MTNQHDLTPGEISLAFSEAFAPSMGQLTFDKLQLEKQVQLLRARIADLEAINASLKTENSNLIEAHIALEDLVNDLQKELEARPTLEVVQDLEDQIHQLIEVGPTVAQSAALDMAKTEIKKEKAAPAEAAEIHPILDS